MNNVLYLPMLCLVTLTVVVWAMAVYRRVREIRIRRIPLQSLAQARQVAVAFEDVQAMDNFNNLLQVPVLFYVLCLAVAQSGSGGELFLAGAWAYVLLRVLHSAIQITHRLLVFCINQSGHNLVGLIFQSRAQLIDKTAETFQGVVFIKDQKLMSLVVIDKVGNLGVQGIQQVM